MTTNVLTPEQYKELRNKGRDYCDCCGGLYEIAGLTEGTMPIEIEEGDYTTLSGGFTVCYLCSQHCDEGPCEPDNLTIVRDPNHVWVSREAGLHATFEWQDSQWHGHLDYTTVLGKVPNTDTYIVFCEGTGYDHETAFPLKMHLAISKSEGEEEGKEKITVDDATKEQINAVME